MKKVLSVIICIALCLALAACGKTRGTDAITDGSPEEETVPVQDDVTVTEEPEEAETVTVITEADIVISDEISSSDDGGHAILADGGTASYSNTAVNKTGDSDGDKADFYGENAAVFATDGASLKLKEMVITTDGTHANAVFSYGEGTEVTITDSVITTSGNCSGGLMTTV